MKPCQYLQYQRHAAQVRGFLSLEVQLLARATSRPYSCNLAGGGLLMYFRIKKNLQINCRLFSGDVKN
jgi:hypothetical protein